MSSQDSFIDEVTEQVRRDRLFGYMRRYGWIAILVVLVLVGGAAWNEWRKAQAEAAAQVLGDAMLAALDIEDDTARLAALDAIAAEGQAAAILALMTAAEHQAAGDAAAAAATLDGLASDGATPVLYRDLAALKALMLQQDAADPADRRNALEALAAPGAPFRLLALEQIAHAELAAGDTAAAIATLRDIAEDAGATRSLRDRAQGLMVALGVDPAQIVPVSPELDAPGAGAAQ